jgi:putative membrane protein insertion efficiency factor
MLTARAPFFQRLWRLPSAGLIALVRFYRFAFSPWLGSSCRFQPTCSAYALEALAQRGAVVGSSLTLWRIARCHPGCAGGFDPVPAVQPRRGLFAFLPNSDTSAAEGTPPAADTAERRPYRT